MTSGAAPAFRTFRERLVRWAGEHEVAAAALCLLALTLAVLGPVLCGDGDRILSNEDADLAMQFVPWRGFGFSEMRAGHLPLWNPHIFSGAPFLGGFQSALLYPPNWLYLVLPLGRAINIGIALHVFLAGFGMYLWARERALHPLAGVFAGVLFMFSGPYFPHIYAGHLPNLCAMVWGPLIFLGIDRWLERRTPGAVLLGGGAVALQILAGHPQYVFYTGVAAGLYCLASLPGARQPLRAAAGLALIPAIGVALSAVQLLEGFHAAAESVRSHGVTFVFASLFAFPPENFVTLLVPGFFGDLTQHLYWGRCSFSEMSLFFGVTGLVCALYGAWKIPHADRFRLPGVAAVLLFLALGAHTPVFHWLYGHVPGFDKFRGLSKFIYPAVLLLILLAATGFDALLQSGRPETGLIAGTAAAALLLMFWAGTLGVSGSIAWWLKDVYATGEVLLSATLEQSRAFQVYAEKYTAAGIMLAGNTLLALSFLLLLARWRPAALQAILLLACAEMLFFAHRTIETCSLTDAQTSPASDYLAAHPAPDGSRILNLENPNLAMSIGARDLWGYDPGVVRRYAEFMADSQGIDPDHLNEELEFSGQPALYASMLRCRYILSPEAFMPANGELPVFTYPAAALAPRLALIGEARVLRGRATILAALREPAFDPRRTVILESSPEPRPAAGDGPPGTVALVGETCNSLTIEATLSRPAILVVSDTFCSGWRADSLLPNPPQPAYQVLPGDYCLRAIPLAAGHHRLALVYRPWAFVLGAWISAMSLALYALAVAKASCARSRLLA